MEKPLDQCQASRWGMRAMTKLWNYWRGDLKQSQNALHMDVLLKLAKVRNDNVVCLRKFNDDLESHVQSLATKIRLQVSISTTPPPIQTK